MMYFSAKAKAILGLFLLAALALAALTIYRAGYSRAELVKQAEIDRLVIEHTEAFGLAIEALRTQEREAAERVAEIDRKHLEEITNVKAEADRTINDLRAGTIRLRNRFTCPTHTDTTGQPSPTASSGDAGEAGGLSETDAGFLVRLAAEADEVVKQLQACQSIIKSDREQ